MTKTTKTSHAAEFEARRASLLAELDAMRAAVLACTPATITLDELDTAACQLAEVHAFGSCSMAEQGGF